MEESLLGSSDSSSAQPTITPYSIVDRSLRRLGESPSRGFQSNESPSWTQSPSTRALKNIGAGTTEILFGSKGSIQSCIMTLASCTIGTGVLALPAAFVETGFAAGLFMVTISVGFNAWTCLLLTHCCLASKQYSYRRIGVAAFGKCGGIVVKLGVVFVLFGIITALQVVLSDSLYKVAHLFVTQPASKWTLSGIAVAVTVLPLSLPSDISALRYTSVIALSSMLYVTIVVVICGWRRVKEVGGVTNSIQLAINETGSFWKPQASGKSESLTLLNVLTNIPVFMMAFGCQVQVPDIFQTMPKKIIDVIIPSANGSVIKSKKRSRSLNDMKWVVIGALCIVCLLYVLLGVSGAIAFVGHWDQLKGDVLIALSTTTKNKLILSNIDAARAVMCISVSLTCPLLVLPCRDTLLQLLGLDWSSIGQSSSNDDEEEEEEEKDRMEANRKSLLASSALNPNRSGAGCDVSGVDGGVGGHLNQGRDMKSMLDLNSKLGGRTKKQKWPVSRLISHSLVTAGLLIVTWILANSISNLKLVLGLTGATGGCFLLYILPAMFYLKLLEVQKRALPNMKSPSCCALLFGWIPLILGTLIMIVSTGSTIYFVSDGTTNTTSVN
jgi:amino acid permease